MKSKHGAMTVEQVIEIDKKKARMMTNKINTIHIASAGPDTSSTDLMNIRTQAIDDTTVQTVNARDLHAFLEVRKDFSTWIKGRIEQFEFVENQDFVTFESAPQNGGAENRGLRVEYHLTLDMAKELSMVERTTKGKEARQYFIECERVARTVNVPVLPRSYKRSEPPQGSHRHHR